MQVDESWNASDLKATFHSFSYHQIFHSQLHLDRVKSWKIIRFKCCYFKDQKDKLLWLSKAVPLNFEGNKFEKYNQTGFITEKSLCNFSFVWFIQCLWIIWDSFVVDEVPVSCNFDPNYDAARILHQTTDQVLCRIICRNANI